jgi:hypothetical protein
MTNSHVHFDGMVFLLHQGFVVFFNFVVTYINGVSIYWFLHEIRGFF